MEPERAKKLRAASSLLAISLVVVSVACLVSTGVLSAFKQMTWTVGLFITLKLLIAVALGGVLGLALGLLVGRRPVVLSSFLALMLIALIGFVHLRISILLSAHTPAMSGTVAPMAESLRDVAFLAGLVAGAYHLVPLRKKSNWSDR